MLAYDLEFGPNTAEAHKKVIYGLCAPRQLLSAYREGCRSYKSTDLALMVDIDSGHIYAAKRTEMSARLQQMKFPAPLMSAHSRVQMPRDQEAFWLIVPLKGEIPIMVVMYALAYEQVAEGRPLIGEA